MSGEEVCPLCGNAKSEDQKDARLALLEATVDELRQRLVESLRVIAALRVSCPPPAAALEPGLDAQGFACSTCGHVGPLSELKPFRDIFKCPMCGGVILGRDHVGVSSDGQRWSEKRENC